MAIAVAAVRMMESVVVAMLSQTVGFASQLVSFPGVSFESCRWVMLRPTPLFAEQNL